MIDVLFWLTGLVAWVWIALMGVSMIAISAIELIEMRQARGVRILSARRDDR
jgi:hypothetical protein